MQLEASDAIHYKTAATPSSLRPFSTSAQGNSTDGVEVRCRITPTTNDHNRQY